MIVMYLLNFILFISFSIIVEARIRVYASTKPLTQIGEKYFMKEILTQDYNDPKELTYDSSSRNLYFMYMDDTVQNSGRAYINVLTKHTAKIEGIYFNKATAVDEETSEVYFGSEDGLYKYDPFENKANKIGMYNVNILKLIVRNNEMFCINGNDHQIYKIIDNGAVVVKVGDWETVIDFEVDNHRNLHFITMDGLYCAAHGHVTVKNKDLRSVDLFIVDKAKTLAIFQYGVYEINCIEGTTRRIGDILFSPRSMAIGDYGVVFFSVRNYIYKLTPVRSYLIYSIDSPDFNATSLNINNTRVVIDTS